jgi:N-acetylglucosamine-6-phosphate deacetylase
MINRHNNPFWSQLADDRLHISIICDSFHLLPEEIRVFYKVKGVAKIILTSDVTSFATLEPGMYQTQTGETIELREDGLLHYPAQKCLYGSASPLTKSIEYIVQVTDCSLAEAIQMASSNTAKLLGLNDRGKVEPGLRADLILFSLEYSKISIHKTFVKGKIVYESSY